jgi:hypothetical protein
MAQSQVLQEKVAAGFQSGPDQTQQKNEPTNHAAEDSEKCLEGPAFSGGMGFLLRTQG